MAGGYERRKVSRVTAPSGTARFRAMLKQRTSQASEGQAQEVARRMTSHRRAQNESMHLRDGEAVTPTEVRAAALVRAGGESRRSIARRLGRSPSTIAREVNVNGGVRRYRACRADMDALRRARRPKPRSWQSA